MPTVRGSFTHHQQIPDNCSPFKLTGGSAQQPCGLLPPKGRAWSHLLPPTPTPAFLMGSQTCPSPGWGAVGRYALEGWARASTRLKFPFFRHKPGHLWTIVFQIRRSADQRGKVPFPLKMSRGQENSPDPAYHPQSEASR